jgi:hypothetical protein
VRLAEKTLGPADVLEVMPISKVALPERITARLKPAAGGGGSPAAS